MAQSQIGCSLRGSTGRARFAAILSQERFDNRRSLGRRICQEFLFVDTLGRLRIAGFMNALAPPNGVPRHPAQINDLQITVVSPAPDWALWYTLNAREHPHGITGFAGRHFLYLVGSAHGLLPAEGYSVTARRAPARDRCITWDKAGDLMISSMWIEMIYSSSDSMCPSVQCVCIPGSKTMVSIFDVATYILKKKGPMTTWKLQKLVYYSQAWSLVWDDKADEAIHVFAGHQACTFALIGPALRSLPFPSRNAA